MFLQSKLNTTWCFIIIFFVPANAHVTSVPQNITRHSPCTDKNHLFLIPGVLTAGGNNRACISRFYPEGPARVVITLLVDNGETVTSARDLKAGDGGCLDISVPLRPNSKAEINVNVRYPEAQCTWERRVTVRISRGRVVVVHTERARYRPGDTVRIRALVLKADLTPAHGDIDEVWVEGPHGAWEGARVEQWQDVRTRLGFAQLQYQIDEQAPPGKWTIRVKLADGSHGSAVFGVGNYELPPFQLTVRHAPRVLRTSERLVWTVCVRYPWTEAVEGMLVIRLRGAGGNGVGGGSPGIRTAVRLRAPRACHRHAAAARRVGLDGNNPPDVVIADFSFQEEGTRIWQNTTVVSQVVDNPVTLEFLTKHRAVLSPSLPYKLKLKATRWDDKPASNERIRVCRSSTKHGSDTSTNATCVEAITDVRGLASIMFTADDDNSLFYQFEARLGNATTTLQLAARHAASRAALGPLRADPHAARTLVPLYLNLTNLTTPLTVHFVVITRGGIIYRWGATTQCPLASTTNQILPAPRNSTCHANLEKYVPNPNFDANVYNLDADPNQLDVNISDTLMDRHLFRVMLPIKVTHQMCPDSHLLAYFYHNGELVSANKHFEMDECFGNKVDATWTARLTAPGTTPTLQLTTNGPAFCALTALDSAATWVQPAPSVKEVVLQNLRKLIEEHRNLTEYDAAEECFLTTDTPGLPTSSIDLTATWLAAAGIRVIGEKQTPNKRCDSTAPAPLQADDSTLARSDFSEAWLWRLVAVGVNGTANVAARAPDSITRYEASALCVARSGVAISTPAVLQVFREFFIHADGPKMLRRGDSTIIRYRLFNYLYEPLSVQIQVLADPHLEGPTDYIESACVGARSSVARRVEVRALVPGNARLSIRAKSVNDGRCKNTLKKNGISDEVIVDITVNAEGVPTQEHKSIMLCGQGDSEPSSSNVSWTWKSVQVVPGTEAMTIWAVGDTTGPLLADADALVVLPRGCGEQNMARLATNLLALEQLDVRSPAASIAREHVARGFTRQLQYVHPKGGFSAFGASDSTPSTWLTAFCLRYLRKAYQVLSPGLPTPPAIDRAEQWLLKQQMENGCFRNEGQVFHRELKGGLGEQGEIASVALTAYVITFLIESSSNVPFMVLRNSLSCLRALPPIKSKTRTGIYAHAVLTYAFMRLKRYEKELRRANEASYMWNKDTPNAGLNQDEEMHELVLLLKLANRKMDYVFWESDSLATSVEATGYALLSLSECSPALRNVSCAHDARAAIRWLATQRNAAGGFVSTQDTLVAMEALIRWSSLQHAPLADLMVTANSGKQTKKLSLQPGKKIPNIVKMAANDQINISVAGTGCALIQATRSYNTISSDDSNGKPLTVQVAVQTDGPFNCDVNKTVCFCAAVVEACVLWSGTFPEMALLEVALPGGFGADAGLLYSQLQQQDTLLRRIELSPNSGKATLYLGTRDGSDTIGRGGNQCFKLHAVGPRAKTKPAHVKIFDYYKPTTTKDTQMYLIPEECPPRISHETNTYTMTDNLFSKAKSLETGEILISHEYSFEDIPEGIPLDDPIYENLTERKSMIDRTKKKNYNDETDLKINNLLQMIHNMKNHLNHKNDRTMSRSRTGNLLRLNVTNNDKLKFTACNQNTTRCSKIDFELSSNNNKFISELKSIKSTTESNINQSTTEVMEAVNIKLQDLLSDVGVLNKNYNDTLEDMQVQQYKNEKVQENIQIDNPNLSNFHVIDTEKDLEFPSGVEGPIPAMILPPKNFAFNIKKSDVSTEIPPPQNYWRTYQIPTNKPYNQKYHDW